MTALLIAALVAGCAPTAGSWWHYDAAEVELEQGPLSYCTDCETCMRFREDGMVQVEAQESPVSVHYVAVPGEWWHEDGATYIDMEPAGDSQPQLWITKVTLDGLSVRIEETGEIFTAARGCSFADW
jgi:hypothetical protein